MRQYLLSTVLAGAVLVCPPGTAAPPPASFTDPSGDANALNHQGGLLSRDVPTDTALPGDAANQAYADVVSVTWRTQRTTKHVVVKGKRTTATTVSGFTVTAVLSAPPVPPPGVVVAYHMLGIVPYASCFVFGVVWFTADPDGPTPQTAVLRDMCNNVKGVIMTPAPAAAVRGNTITWTVPSAAIPSGSLRPGFDMHDLRFVVSERTLGIPVLDDGESDAYFAYGQ